MGVLELASKQKRNMTVLTGVRPDPPYMLTPKPYSHPLS